MYVIQTEHESKEPTLSKPMEFEEARSLFSSITGIAESKIKEDKPKTEGAMTLREAKIDELTYEEDGVLMVDNIIDTFSNDRLMIAWERTSRKFGDLAPDPDDKTSDFAEAFHEQFEEELKLMAAKDLMDYLQQTGIVKVSGINQDGYEEIEITEKGHRLLEDV